MAGTSSASLKRSKPNYIYSIIGVAIVLFIMGIMGWLFLNLRTIGDNFKEDIRISVYLKSTDKNTIGKLQGFIAGQPYAKNVEYVNKEKAKAIWNAENSEDWAKILDVNPLPESVDFFAKADYVNPDSLNKITANIGENFKNEIADIQYPKSLVTSLNERAAKVGIIFLVMSIILCIIVIISIDNTIRLAMFSNRFLIKTMQMVGATRSFISKPLVIRALMNGLISAGIALVVLFGLIQWTAAQFPQIQTLQGMGNNLILFFGLIIVGVGISVLSTYRSVVKYLKMKLDELY
jgi:cell division transport system permease protein